MSGVTTTIPLPLFLKVTTTQISVMYTFIRRIIFLGDEVRRGKFQLEVIRILLLQFKLRHTSIDNLFKFVIININRSLTTLILVIPKIEGATRDIYIRASRCESIGSFSYKIPHMLYKFCHFEGQPRTFSTELKGSKSIDGNEFIKVIIFLFQVLEDFVLESMWLITQIT